MMYVDQTSQYKFVARTAPNLAQGETTSSTVASDVTVVPPAQNAPQTTVHAPPNTATHFQATEHVQKQATALQNVTNVVQPGDQSTTQAQAGMVPGQGLTYDGKRMRKSVQRRTVDYNSSVIRFLEARKWFKSSRNQHALQAEEIYNVDVVPPCGYIKNPMNSVTTKFVRTSTNKLRCPIFCVVWTPEGRRLVTGASSGEFTLWNGLTFNFETILQAHDRAVRSMVWSHNDSWLLTGDHGGFVKYWQSNMNNVRMYEAHKDPVRGLSFSPSDNKFASCSDDGLVKVWDFYRCAEERELKGHGADVKCVDWHPSKGLIVSGSKDSQQPVKIWDPKSGNSITTLHCHKSTVMTAKWNSNGNWLVTGSRDHLLKLFDIRMMKELQTFRGHKKEATVVAWHPVHETLFASGGSDGSLMFWLTGVDEKAGAMEKAHEGIVWSLSWHPLGHILCSGSNDHTSKFWARNRPGDAMTDKYNLDIQGNQEEGEHSEESTSQTSVPALAAYNATTVIPGVGQAITASNVVLPDSKDVDAHLYGESSKDNQKTTVSQASAIASSESSHPPAFKQPTTGNRPGTIPQGKPMIPGLDMANETKQENEGFDKIPRFPPPTTPPLRLPLRLPTTHPNHPPPGNRPPMGNFPNPGNRPPFGPGPRHGFDFRGPPGQGGQDPNMNFGPSGPFPPNQFMRFPGFGQQRGPGPQHPGSFGAPGFRGPHGGPPDFQRLLDGPFRGPRPLNIPPGQHGFGPNEGPQPRGGPPGPNVRPDGLHGGPRPFDFPPNQHGPRDGPQGRPFGEALGQHGPLHGGPRPTDGQSGMRDGPQGRPHDEPNDQHRPPHVGPDNTPGQHELRDSPHRPQGEIDSPRGLPGSRDGPWRPPDSPQGHSDGPQGPRDGSPGPRDGPPGSRDGAHGPRDGSRGGRDGLQGERDGPPGPRDGPRGPRDSPPGPRDGPRRPRDGPHGPRDGPPGGVRDGRPEPRDGRPEPRDGPDGPRDGPRRPRDGPPGARDGPPGARDGPPGPRDGPHGGRDGPRGPRDSPPGGRDSPHGPRDGPLGRRDGPHGGRDGLHGGRDGPHGVRDGPHGGRDGPPGPRDGPRGARDGPPGPRDDPHGPRDGPPGPRDGPRGPRDGPRGPRDGPPGPRDGPPGPRDGPRGPRDGAHGGRDGPHGPRDSPRGPRDGPHGAREGPPGLRDGPQGARDGPRGPRGSRDDLNFGPPSSGPRGPRPSQFQPPRTDQPKPELKSPESDHRDSRENFRRRSRDNSPRDSPPVLSGNHGKQERRTSDSDAPGILGDYVTHVQVMQRDLLANIAKTVVGLPLGQPLPDMGLLDLPAHGRSDMDRPHGPGDRPSHDRFEEDHEDRPPYDSRDRPDLGPPGRRSPRERERERARFDRAEMGRREDRSPRERSDLDRPRDRQRDRPSFEGRGVDRAPMFEHHEDRGPQDRPGGRPPFDRQDSGRQSDRDRKDLPAHEKPGLLPIPDLFLGLGPHDGPSHDPGSPNHRPPDRRRDHGRFQDARNEPRHGDGPSGGETNIKPLMSLLDAPPLASPPGKGENRGRKRSMEQEFDRPPKRIGTGDNREFRR